MNEYAASILANNKYCIVSTTTADGAPWSTPVHYACDDENFYWLSNNLTIHSQNIIRDGRAFVIVFDSRQDEKGAVYSATVARELNGDEAEQARAVYLEKWPHRNTDKFQEWSVYAAPIGELNIDKTKDAMVYYVARETT